MDKACTCCFTGHRELNPDKGLPLALATLNTIYDALIDGYTQFITGLAEGADMMFAKDVIFLRQRHPEIKLFAAISHEGRLKSKDEEFQELLSYCDKYYLISLFYHGGVYSARNKWMLKHSSRLIAVWDGRLTGGTYQTIKLAEKLGIDTRTIDANDPKYLLGPQ